MFLTHALRAIFRAAVVTGDSLWKFVTLLISGTPPAVTFISDASTNGNVLTLNGDTRPSNFNPYTPGYYSNFFDGTGDYVSVPDSTAFTMGAGDFTLEAWVYLTTSGTSRVIIGTCDAAGTQASMSYTLSVNTSNNLLFGVGYNGTMYYSTNTGTVPINQWVHVAGVRNGANVYAYLNGVQSTSNTNMGSLAITDSSQVVGIGRNGAYNGEYVTGYISNVRIVKGTAVYTGAFTVPTSPLQATQSSGTNIAAITGTSTSLLTCQSNRFIDNSLNNFVITKNGDTTVSGFIPFTIPTILNGVTTTYLGSGYFDGTGDYLGLASNSSSSFGTSNFTVECWVYMTANSSYRMLLGNGTSYLCVIDGVLNAFYTGVSISSASTVPLNTWTHVAFVRSSGTMYFYINGVLSGSGAFAGTWGAVGVSNIGFSAAYAGLYFYTGNISNFRIVNGTAVYTANFTPPTAPLTAVTNTQLLTLQTNQPAANKQFVDNSGNNFPITQVGNATQGTFSPYGANWSNYFSPGQSNYIQTTIQAMTANFTVECWVYVTSLANSGVIIGQTWELWVNTSGTVSYYTPASVRITTSLTVSLNTWTHIALVRSSGIAKIYINGVADAATYTNSATVGSLETTYIARDPGTSGGYNGYISNLRIVNGTAVYTSTFTPSTTPLTAITNTSLLTCQSPRFIDTSINAYAVTITGSPTVQRFSPFNPSSVTPTSYSGYFDGNGDYLSVPDNAAWNYGTGDFTIEFWVLFSAFPSSTWMVQLSQFADANNRISVFFGNNASNENGLVFKAVVAGTAYKAVENDSANITMSSLGYSTSTWYHVAISRSGSSFKGFINGVQKCSLTSSVTLPDLSAPLLIGAYDTTPLFVQNGYISNLRIVKGTAVYTAAFTPPTAPLTAISGTSLLTCQSATHRDNSANALTITQAGDAIPRQFNPFGFTNTTTGTAYTPALYGGSAYFDGTGDYLSIPDSDAFAYGTGNFTIESWIYPTATGDRRFYNQYPDSSTQGFIRLNNSTNTIAVNFILSTSSVIAFNSSTAVSLNVWTHFAFVRNGSTFTIYLNGVSSGTGTYAGSMPNYNAPLLISSYDGTNEHWIGYIADLRITKGTALYKGNFVPPLTPLTATAGTTLLLNMDKGAVVDSSRCVDLETVGDAKVRYETPYAGSYYSNYFDGTGDYLSFTSSSASALATGDFTFEMWLYWNGTSVDVDFYRYNFAGSDWAIGIYNTATNISIANFNGAERIYFGSKTQLTSNQWNHLAITRSGNTFRCFVNGALDSAGAQTNTASMFNTLATTVAIGRFLVGSMSNVRLVRGTAVYTANFTPSTTPLTAISGTSLLTCQSKSFVDNSSNNFTITRNGDVAVRSQNPFQKNTYSSMLFDGTGDYLAVPAGPQFNFGTGDFTIEAWVYPQQLTTDWFIISASGTGGLFFGYAPSTGGYGWGRAAIAWDYQPATSKTLNAWQHVAISRSGTSMRIFVDGVQQGTTQTNSTAYNLSVTSTTIGSQGSSYVMTGYIDDLRITRGYARYTANFTPPTAPLPTS